MDWIDEADGVFRGGGVKGLGLAGALLGFAEHPKKPVNGGSTSPARAPARSSPAISPVGHDAADMADLLEAARSSTTSRTSRAAGKFFGGGPNLVRRHGLAPRRGVPDVVRRRARAQDVRASPKTDDGERLAAEADRRRRDEPARCSSCRTTCRATGASARRQPIDPDDVPDRRRGADEHVDPVLLRAVPARARPRAGRGRRRRRLARRRRARPTGSTSCTANAMRGASATGRRRRFRELTEKRAEAPALGDRRRRHALELPGLALRRRHARQPLDASDVRLHAHGRQGRRRGIQQLRRAAAVGGRFGFDIFHTAQEAWDARFVSHSTRVRTVTVDAGTVGTTEFNLTRTPGDADQERPLGAQRFLDRFDLADYENTYHRGFETTGT